MLPSLRSLNRRLMAELFFHGADVECIIPALLSLEMGEASDYLTLMELLQKDRGG